MGSTASASGKAVWAAPGSAELIGLILGLPRSVAQDVIAPNARSKVLGPSFCGFESALLGFAAAMLLDTLALPGEGWPSPRFCCTMSMRAPMRMIARACLGSRLWA